MTNTNERITEELIRQKLRELQAEDPNFIFEEQKSGHTLIQRLLKKASKRQTGERGAPDFILRHKIYKNIVIIIECKADTKWHQSEGLDRPADFAVDGAIHYARCLTERFTVIAVGFSGDKTKSKLSTFLCIGDKAEDLKLNTLLSFEDYDRRVRQTPEVIKESEKQLIRFSRDLHNYIRDRGKLSEGEKPLLVGAVLVALRDNAFWRSYGEYETCDRLARELLNSVKVQLEKGEIPESKTKVILSSLLFLLHHPTLSKTEDEYVNTPLFQIVERINQHIRPILNIDNSFDIIGHFYQEFLSYTAGDKKGLGIVLTPPHITELFCDLAKLDEGSIVLDTCCGTGGFLVAAMNYMVKKASSTDPKTLQNIRSKQLIGIEQQPHMYALAALGMILRGDGKSNLYNQSCFETTLSIKPTHSLINPPYSQKGEGLSELDFILCQLNLLAPNGTAVSIVPMSVAISGKKELREELMRKHSLLAVVTMPADLFPNVGVNTVVMVWRAHSPHDSNIKTWLCKLADDGFIKTKNRGRCDYYNKWAGIKANLLECYRNKTEIAGFSTLQSLTPADEWLYEAWGKPDYSRLTEKDFFNVLKAYTIFKIGGIK